MRTYDIINAGTKNRFMANGKIVSNSSRGAQLQNLPRGGTIKDIDNALLAVLDGASPDDIAGKYGAPMIVASELVRPTFVSPKNMWLARGDYAQVELRAGAFLAGQLNALQGFADYDTILGYDEKGKPKRKGPDRYRVTAAGIFQVSVSEIDDAKRQGGKIGDLACGFGGGKGAFQAFAKIYNFNVSDTEAQGIVDGWRAANPYVVQFWQDLEDNAIAAMKAKTGTKFVIKTIRGDLIGGKPKHTGRPYNPGLWFIRGKSALILRLPSGNCLFYWYPKLEKKMTNWGESWQVTYMAECSQTKLWKRWSMWGGILCENAVQSFARDIMARAIVRMDKAGLDPVLTVHDEGIGQISYDRAATASEAAELVRREMLATEEWYAKMPLAVDASAGPRYAKA